MAHSPSGGVQLTEFVKRPGLGREGRPLKVRANFFEVQSLPQQDLHHYDVTITPDVPPALNRRIFQQFEDMYRADLANIKTVFDGTFANTCPVACFMCVTCSYTSATDCYRFARFIVLLDNLWQGKKHLCSCLSPLDFSTLLL